MIAVPAPIPPAQLKRVLELHGYRPVSEDEFNWAMARGNEVPLIIPKDGEYVSVDVMMDALHRAGLGTLGDYFPLRDRAAKELGLAPN
jgi:hypothetical protein